MVVVVIGDSGDWNGYERESGWVVVVVVIVLLIVRMRGESCWLRWL